MINRISENEAYPYFQEEFPERKSRFDLPGREKRMHAFPRDSHLQQTLEPLPSLVKWFCVTECVLLGPVALHHYCSFTNRKQLNQLTSNRVAWMVMHSSEMLNGVGAWIVVFIAIFALAHDAMRREQLLILVLAHSLWVGTVAAYWPLSKEAGVLHIPLFLGALALSAIYLPPWLLGVAISVVLIGRLKFHIDVQPNIMDGDYEKDMAAFRGSSAAAEEPTERTNLRHDAARTKSKTAPRGSRKGTADLV